MKFRFSSIALLVFIVLLASACGSGGGTGDGGTTEFISLTVGASPTSGNVDQNSSNFYSFFGRVGKGYEVILISSTGDADLAVYSDETMSQSTLVDISIYASTVDTVRVTPTADQIFYIEVFGYTTASYEIYIVEAPVALYKFEEGTGTVALNSAANRLHGDIYGAVRKDGKVGNALLFDATGDRVVIEMDIGQGMTWDKIPFPTNNVSIEAWVKLSSFNPGSVQNVIGSGYYGLRSFRFQINDGKVELLLADSDNNNWNTIITGDNVLAINTWHHIAVTFDGSEARTYVDGILDNTKLITFPIPTNYNRLYIGAVSSQSFGGYENDFLGLIDELLITDVVLSPTEIASYYQATK